MMVGESNCFVKWAAKFTQTVKRICVSAAVPKLFFPKVISPSNYNGAVVAMGVVRNHSRRYNPHPHPLYEGFQFPILHGREEY